MKTINKFFIGAACLSAALSGTVLTTSCSDLDEHPYTFIDPASYYKTPEEVETALEGTYNRFRRLYSGNNALYLAHIELLTEQGWPNYTKDNMENISKWSYANDASTGGALNLWGYVYECVNRANIVLARAEEVSMSDEARNRIKGQAYFLRGYAFFHLIRLHGGIALPLTYTKSLDGLQIPRASLEESYAQVISDLEQAESLLPARGTAGYDVWRVSKGAAQAALGEVYLYRGTMNNNNQQDLQAAKDWSEKVIKSGIYMLSPEFTDNIYWFNENCKNNQESVFELQFSATEGQANGMHHRFGLGRTNAPYIGAYQYCRFGVSGFLCQEMQHNGDKRAKAFLTYFEGDGTNYKEPSYTYNAETYHWEPKITNDKDGEHRCCFNLKYFDHHFDDPAKMRELNTLGLPCPNFPILRYAEVLLNYAEAANLLHAGDGLAELNMVRNRAGLANYTGNDLDEEIFQQRRFEFVGEGKLFYDELRKDRLAEYATKKCAMGTENDIIYLKGQIVFKPTKSYLFKIKQGDLDSNPALEQNPDNVSK